MKKIPTLFTRVYKDHKVVDISDQVTPGCEGALDGTLHDAGGDGSSQILSRFCPECGAEMMQKEGAEE